MSKELKNIKNTIMDQIYSEKIKMRPKVYFIIGAVLTFVGLVSSFIVSMFLFGLMRFSLRSHGPMGSYRLEQILSSFPWQILILAVIGIIFGVWLIRKYDFSLRFNPKLIIITFVSIIIIGGWLVDFVGLDNMVINRWPMRRMMGSYNHNELNTQNTPMMGYRRNMNTIDN